MLKLLFIADEHVPLASMILEPERSFCYLQGPISFSCTSCIFGSQIIRALGLHGVLLVGRHGETGEVFEWERHDD